MSYNLRAFVAVEDRTTEKQVVENQSGRKNIADWITSSLHLFIFDVDDFGCHEPRSPTPHEQILLGVSEGRKPEITDSQLTGALGPKHYIGWF